MLKPPDPEKIQSARCVIKHFRPSVDDIDVIDAKHSGIAEMIGIRIAFLSKQHDIAMRCVGINDILRTSNIVCRIVDPEQIVFVNAVGLEEHTVKAIRTTH
jgi:hypothetical protein